MGLIALPFYALAIGMNISAQFPGAGVEASYQESRTKGKAEEKVNWEDKCKEDPFLPKCPNPIQLPKYSIPSLEGSIK